MICVVHYTASSVSLEVHLHFAFPDRMLPLLTLMYCCVLVY